MKQSLVAALVLSALGSGCGSPASSSSTPVKPPTAEVKNRVSGPQAAGAAAGSSASRKSGKQSSSQTAERRGPPRRSLANLLSGTAETSPFDDSGDNPLSPQKLLPRPPEIDEPKIFAAGIRKLTGTHLTLYTDLPPDPAVDELPAVYDLAVPQWCEYFGVPAAKVVDWKMVGYLVEDKELFRALNLLPDDLPPFRNGFQRYHELWFYDQPSAFYRRHLLLHEGTHAFMNWHLGGCGPPWYMEGLAEFLGTHEWRDGRLQLGYFPRSRDEVPHWGRVKIVKDETDAGRGMLLSAIMQLEQWGYERNEPYGWCWAAVSFLDRHPLSREPFRRLASRASDRSLGLSKQFYDEMQPQWCELTEQWQLFVVDLDYGYDLDRELIVRKPAEPIPASGATVEILASRGWQSTGLRLEAGVMYELAAAGRYQVADQPEIWWSEPGGVTIRYHKGRPLGMLLAAVGDLDPPPVVTPLAKPEPIGIRGTIKPAVTGTLYLRINDSPAELGDNAGAVRVEIRQGAANGN